MSSIAHIDLSSRLDTSEFREILLILVGWREDHTINVQFADEAVQAYRRDPHAHVLGVEENGCLVGMIGLKTMLRRVVLFAISLFVPLHGVEGLGRAMIANAKAHFGLKELVAETDNDAVEFYRRCGFEVQSLGEKYPGTERFLCVQHMR